MYYELNKKDKKLARLLIDKSLNLQYNAALEEAQELISFWQQGKLTNSEAYLRLFKMLEKHDNSIAKRYNRLGGSKYLITVANILFEELITYDEVKDFSPEALEMINRFFYVYTRE